MASTMALIDDDATIVRMTFGGTLEGGQCAFALASGVS